jgi:antitoxin YefM
VPSIRPSSDVLPVTQFRAQASAVLDQLRITKRPIFLTQHGRGAAVLMDVTVYEELLDRIERLTHDQASDPPVAADEAPAPEKPSGEDQAAAVDQAGAEQATAPDSPPAAPDSPAHPSTGREKTVAEIKKQLWGGKLEW